MRMLDVERKQGVYNLQFYLSPKEAAEFHKYLGELLEDHEANEHRHVFAQDMSREVSFSIVTPSKLEDSGYTELEHSIFDEE